MAAIEMALKPYFAKEKVALQAWNAAKANSASIVASLSKGAAKQLLRKAIGQGVEEIEEILAQESFVSEDVEKDLLEGVAKAEKNALDEVSTLLTKYVDKKLTDYQARISSSVISTS